jgi:hypothetical protein
MTCRDTLQCVHEPFGDAWYFGPERMHHRYESNVKAREDSGFKDSTFKTIFDRIEQENTEVRYILSLAYIVPDPIQKRIAAQFNSPEVSVILVEGPRPILSKGSDSPMSIPNSFPKNLTQIALPVSKYSSTNRENASSSRIWHNTGSLPMASHLQLLRR